jgi:hypothetical protein
MEFENVLIVKDSLGLGIKKSIPKEKIYTDEENDQFTRQLLSEKEKSDLSILEISAIRNIIIENSNRDSYDKIDPDLLIAVDSRINYNIYIIEDNIYTYEELCTVYPFQEFNISPDSIFTRQIIIIFDDNLIEVINDGDPIISTYDLIKLGTATMANLEAAAKDIKRPSKIIRSKIFIGGEKWKDFLQLRGFFRGMIQVSNLQIDNGQTPEFLKPFTLAISNQLMLEGGATESSTTKSSNTESSTIESSTTKSSNTESSTAESSTTESSTAESSTAESSTAESIIKEEKIKEEKNKEKTTALEKKINSLEERIILLEERISLLKCTSW